MSFSKFTQKRSAHPSPPSSPAIITVKHYMIGDHVELQSPEEMIPLDFGDMSEAFEKGDRGFLVRITTTVFCVCCCRKVNRGNSSVEIVSDEGSQAVMMFPDSWCVFKLHGILFPLYEYTVFGFNLGDVISDYYNTYELHVDGCDLTSECNHRGGFPTAADEEENRIQRVMQYDPQSARIIFNPPLSPKYAGLPKSDKVFRLYTRAREASVYVGGYVKNPEVGQIVCKRTNHGCYILAVIVHVADNHVILRDNTDYATRRIKRLWGRHPLSADPLEYREEIMCVRRLDRWMTVSCKCVPMLPHLQDRDWRQWNHSELLHFFNRT